MSHSHAASSKTIITALKPWIFPLACAGLYVLGFVLAPEKTLRASGICIQMVRQLAFPMGLAVLMMILLNRFLSPTHVARFLGRHAGAKGILFSSLAGILSMGPVYAWYPLFTTLKEKGASSFHIANFICYRAVKPVLLPVLLSYFNWKMTGIFLFMTLVGAMITAGCVAFVCRRAD